MTHSLTPISVFITPLRGLVALRQRRSRILSIHSSCNHPSHTKVTGHSTGSCPISEWTSPRRLSTASASLLRKRH